MTSDIVSLVASIVSLIIGFFAIWLSVTFYKLSTKNAEETKRASEQINSTVDRLEVLFDKMYSDTFSIMKDTVTDMRQHVWRKENGQGDVTEEIVKEELDRLKKEFMEQLQELIPQDIKKEEKLENLAENYLEQSRIIEKELKDRATRNNIILAVSMLTNTKRTPTVISISDITKLDGNTVAIELLNMREEGLVDWHGSGQELHWKDEVNLISKDKKA